MSVTRLTRTVHRLISPAFVVTAVLSLIYTAAGGSEDSPLFVVLGIVLVGSLLTLIVTGTVMYVQHLARRRRRKPTTV